MNHLHAHISYIVSPRNLGSNLHYIALFSSRHAAPCKQIWQKPSLSEESFTKVLICYMRDRGRSIHMPQLLQVVRAFTVLLEPCQLGMPVISEAILPNRSTRGHFLSVPCVETVCALMLKGSKYMKHTRMDSFVSQLRPPCMGRTE